MFRRYPYWGWLGISVLLWCINIVHLSGHRQEMLPVKMANTINSHLQGGEAACNDFITDTALLRHLFQGTITEKEMKRVTALPFYVYGYSSDTLKFWNNNSVVATNHDSLRAGLSIRRNAKGTFIRKCINLDKNTRVIALFPVLITYPLENDYLHTHFAASDNIPVSTRINNAPTGSAHEYKLSLQGNVTAGYLLFNPADIQKWVPDTLLIVMLLLAVLSSIAWLQLMAVQLSRGRSAFFALGLIITFSLLLRAALFIYGLPFHLDALPIFSPTLYASSTYLSSLGDLFIDVGLALWLVTFTARYTHYKRYFTGVKDKLSRNFLFGALTVLLVVFIFFYIKIIRSLVLDSSISFDVTHFYAINIYTVFGLVAIISITAIASMVTYIFNVQLKVLSGNKWVKYFVVIATGIVWLYLSNHYTEYFYWSVLACLVLFIALLDLPAFTLVSKLFEPHMIIWALIICGFCTLLIRYFNEVKEDGTRRAFVDQHLTPNRDVELEFSFEKSAKKIELDTQLKSFFYKPTAAGRRLLDQHFETQYLTGQINKYEAEIYLFDADFRPVFNKDTSDYKSLMEEKAESDATNSSYLFYKESILDRHYYLSHIPVYSDTVNNIIGYVMIDLDLKKSATQTVYPELLQPFGNKSAMHENEYVYAVYVNSKLINQTNDHSFPIRLKYDTLKEQQYEYRGSNGYNTLYYKIADKRTAVVVHNHGEVIEAITLFSYLFGIQVLVALIIFIYQLYLSYYAGLFKKGNILKLTLRRRVHLSMLSVVFVSFLIIGTVTIKFFSSEYRDSNANKLQAALQVAHQQVQEYLTNEDGFTTGYVFDTVSKSAGFKKFITQLANSQKIDINVFDHNGTLFATSQEEIYDKGLISRKMRPDAYFELNNAEQSLVIQNEKVGLLSYNSAYQPLRDDHGVTLGYINVPFFSSEKDLNFQISNIVVTLVNLYAFIFLISSVITVGVTRWITSTFDIIIKQFDKINLEQNERIEWPYDDEIGTLVKEYNKMVKKVEENAAKLAQSERETAWREMARQVAHEIKNPLTPMKLNIQYLQQAMRNDNPNVKALTERVSNSIIEQIDNLSYIASEFSNFAKLPEARPEDIDIAVLLHKAVELYNNNDGLLVSITAPPAKIIVLSDRSQLLRVFTNLLENAKQAIPPEKQGVIHVSLNIAGSDVIIAITDNGHGIDEEVAKRIFQPYFTTKSSGTGLGLAMTRKIIEFWNGQIWFETKPGEGTTFFINLPVSETAVEDEKTL
ncbi:MAG: GHKL domain-containing protein [Taibaiella sp.]|nr:GHKL domain-containing protein [Taibaiella sp.]